ncbi:MAG: HNH endonuclease signature motif containing protein, partial [Roseiarcus sp.]
MLRPYPSQSELHRLLDYDPETGLFRYRAVRAQCIYVGDIVGYIHNNNGYVYIIIDNAQYLAHILAWIYVHGYRPDEIDHDNTIKNDNRLINLRECTTSQNSYNKAARVDNTSGYKGVYYYKPNNKWQAAISGSNLTFESWLGFPMRARRASLRDARRKIPLRFVRRYSPAQS